MSPVRPNFFIVGAPKSGTTTLYRYLRQHPAVFMPLRKEPHHFATDLYAPRYVYDEAEYLALFEEGRGKKAVGEASVYHLYSKVAAKRIYQFDPDAKVIIMLRNPVDMVHSLHSQRLYSGYEDIEVFEDALAAEEDRMRGQRIPAQGYPIECLLYTQVGMLGQQVSRYLDVFPRGQIQFIEFEQFANDTSLAYERVCAFLGVPGDYEPEWAVHNANKRVRSEGLRKLMKFNPKLNSSVRSLLPFSVRRPIKRALVKANTKYEARPPLREQTRQELQHIFAEDVHLLRTLIDIDLGHWTSGVETHDNQVEADRESEEAANLTLPT